MHPLFHSLTTTSLPGTPTSLLWASRPWESISLTSMYAWTHWLMYCGTHRNLWSPQDPWSTCGSESCLQVRSASNYEGYCRKMGVISWFRPKPRIFSMQAKLYKYYKTLKIEYASPKVILKPLNFVPVNNSSLKLCVHVSHLQVSMLLWLFSPTLATTRRTLSS